jgi:hypothetical protein
VSTSQRDLVSPPPESTGPLYAILRAPSRGPRLVSTKRFQCNRKHMVEKTPAKIIVVVFGFSQSVSKLEMGPAKYA